MFLYPNFLWLLSLPLLLLVHQLRNAPEASGPSRIPAAILRLLALSLITLALARPSMTLSDSGRSAVAVVDCSPSMDSASLDRATVGLKRLVQQYGREKVRLVTFGKSAREIPLNDDVLSTGGLEKLRVLGAGSSIAEALGLAAALCPDDGNADIHLFSDGRETRGDMTVAAASIGRRGLDLEIHEAGAASPDSILLTKVRGPASANIGEAVTFFADVESRSAVETTLKVTNEKGATLASRNMTLRKGLQQIPFQLRPEESGTQHYTVSLDGIFATIRTGLEVSRTVLGVFETAPESPAANTLRALLGPNAEIKPLALADLTGEGLSSIDALVLADTPASELPPETQRKLREYVENGGGLLVTGGRNTFGPGGYAQSDLAPMLPLRFPQKKEIRDPSTALAVIIDTSASMQAEGVSLAKEIARLAIKRLKPHDKAGIVEFHGAKRWAAPMQPASNSIALQRALNRLSPGGGTLMMPGIEEAYYGLLNVRARTKHILLLTDGGVEQAPFEKMLRRMTDDGIQFSAVLIGPRSGASLLSRLTNWGQGQFYTAPSRFKLPEVIIKQPSSSLLNPFVEKPTGLEAEFSSTLTQNLSLGDAPDIIGYVKTEPKETAELLLRSDLGDPILARWHFGLGRVAILTTRLGDGWAEDFLGWQGAADLIANTVRELRGTSSRQPLELTLTSSTAGIDIDIRALTQDPTLASAPLRISVGKPGAPPTLTREIMPTRAATWATRITGLQAGDYTVSITRTSDTEQLASGSAVIREPAEFTGLAPDSEKLAATARTAAGFAANFTAAERPSRIRELWPICATLGLISFVLMILARRLPSASLSALRRPTASTLALSAAILGILATAPPATAQETAAAIQLSRAEVERIDAIAAQPSAEARQSLIEYANKLVASYGTLLPLCDYLASRPADGGKTGQLLAVAAIADGNLELARTTLNTLAKAPTADPWTPMESGRVEEMLGNPAKALLHFTTALEKATDPAVRFVTLVRIAQIQYDTSSNKAARSTIRKILAEPDFDNREGRNYCARIAGLHADHELTAELFTPAGEGRRLMQDRIYLGETLMRLGKPREAREQYAAALGLTKLQRDRRYVLDRIVAAAREAGQVPTLMEQWVSAGDILPEQLEILVEVLGGELGRAEDLLAFISRPDFPAATQKLIESSGFQERIVAVALETGKAGLAREKFLNLIKLHPDDFQYKRGFVRLLLMQGERQEAQEFFRKTLTTTDAPGSLIGLAKAARDLGLIKVAREASAKAKIKGVGGEAHIQTGLFEADMFRREGKADKALAVLRDLEKAAGQDPTLIVAVGEAYESFGYPTDTIRLVRRAHKITGNEKLLQKLISLLEEANQHNQVYQLWLQLWETATEPMLVTQAQDKLISIGSKNGKLADMAIGLEERADNAKLSERELAMLLEIYTSVNDPVSAGDILIDLSKQAAGDKISINQRLLQVYMECELFGRCKSILRKLIKADPANRDEYLQSLALIALESGNSGDAVDVLQELASRSEGGVLRDSFSASILGMIGKNEEAALVHRRSLAENPDEIETWLLWGNSLGGMKMVTGKFSALLEESADDDMFTIAIDGLLNGRTSPQVLRTALRRINERIALDPHKMFLYRLASDITEIVLKPDDTRHILEQALFVADDERSILLRELMSMASAAGLRDEVIRYGRSLLNTAKRLPPNDCLELGSMLLAKGYHAEADNAFRRVIADGNVTGATLEIVVSYENAGLYSKAEELLRQLLIGDPFDVGLLLRLAIMEEKKANIPASLKAYQQAIDLVIGRRPRFSEKVGDQVVRSSTADKSDEDMQYYGIITQGLISSARTTDDRLKLLNSLRRQIQSETESLTAENAFGESLAENPRLQQLTDLMRRAAIVFHRPAYFDPMDDQLLKLYPQDKGLARRLKNERENAGITANAIAFGARNNLKSYDPPFTGLPLDDSKRMAEFLRTQRLNVSNAGTAQILLAMCGHYDLLKSTVGSLQVNDRDRQIAVPLSAAGLAADSPALISKTLSGAFNMAIKSRRKSPPEFQALISAAWPLLPEADRKALIGKYGKVVDLYKDTDLQKNRSFQHFLMTLDGQSKKIDIKDLQSYAKGAPQSAYPETYAWETIVRWLIAQPAAKRPAALEKILANGNDGSRSLALTRIALLLDDSEIDTALVAVFKRLFKPSSLTGEQAVSARAVMIDFNTNRLTKLLRKSILTAKGVQASLLTLGEDPLATAEAIRLMFDARITASRTTLEKDITSVFTLQNETLRLASNYLPEKQLDLLLKERIKSDDPIDALISFLLLRQAGRDADALKVLDRIAALPGNDPHVPPVRAVLPRILLEYGWSAPAARFVVEGEGDPTDEARIFFSLHDPLALLRGNPGNVLASGARRIHAARLMKDPAQFLQANRIYWADTRHPSVLNDLGNRTHRRSWPTAMTAAPGGLLGITHSTSRSSLDELSSMDGIQDELSSWLAAMTDPGSRVTDAFAGPVSSAIAANAHKRGISPALRAKVEAAADLPLLNKMDNRIISNLAIKAPQQLPPALATHISDLILSRSDLKSPADPELGRMCEALGLGRLAQSLSLWTVACDIQVKGTSRWLPDYLATLPGVPERRKALARLLPHMGINEVRREPGGEEAILFTALLDLGMDAEASKLVERYLLRLRLNDDRSRSGKPSLSYNRNSEQPALQNALALALARLDRPDDYRRILIRQATLDQGNAPRPPLPNGYSRKPFRASPLAATDTKVLADYTRSLPAPGQVSDINRYLNIHLEANAWLKEHGIISRESYIARLCILGQWSSKHGLDTKAAAFLKLAGKLSEGMTTGRLWIADLHRLLGEEEQAVAIERALLNLDLLPLSRVPSLLARIAAKDDQPRADKIAYHVSSYSNHPEILPLALRHAQLLGLKEEGDDLAERLQKVSTLFLPTPKVNS